MPQLDLESFFCVGGGGEARSKVACETAALPGSDADGQCNTTANSHTGDADARAESRGILIGEGIRSWAKAELTGGAMLQRDGFTKGSSNPKTAAEGTRKSAPPRPCRLPARKTAIVAGVVLPAGKLVVQKRRAPCLGRDWRRPAAGARVFASEAAVGTEPASPKVSCFGAVQSESRAAEQSEERSGCWANVAAVLQQLCRSSNNRGEDELGAGGRKDIEASESPAVAVMSPPRPVLGLGDVKRLASRRWPESIAGEGRAPV